MIWREGYRPSVQIDIPLPAALESGLWIMGSSAEAFREMFLWDKLLAETPVRLAALDPQSFDVVAPPSWVARLELLPAEWAHQWNEANRERALVVLANNERAEVLHLGPPTEETLELILNTAQK